MVRATIVGFPRLGPMREAKTVIEKYWSGKGDIYQLVLLLISI